MRNNKITGVERFIYFIVNTSRLFGSKLRTAHLATKIKHYVYFSRWINDKYKLGLDKDSINNQVLIALDPEWSHLFKNHYVDNEWDYYFESTVTLDSNSAYHSQSMVNDKINVLNDYALSDKTPTVSDVEDDMIDSFRQDYIDVSLDDTSDEGVLEDVHSAILLPEDDSMVQYLNNDTDPETGELVIDLLSEDDLIEYVSNEKISELIESDFRLMLDSLADDKLDSSPINQYTEMIAEMDLYTLMEINKVIKEMDSSLKGNEDEQE